MTNHYFKLHITYFFILCISIFTTPKSLNAKDKKFNTVYSKRIELLLPITEGITATIYDNKVYYFSKQIDINSHINNGRRDSFGIVVYVTNINTETIDSFYLYFPNDNEIQRWQFKSIAISNKYIAVRGDKVYFFDYESKRILSTYNEKRVRDVFFVNPKVVVMTDSYNYHPLDDSINNKIIFYDVNAKKTLYYVQPTIDNIIFTHFDVKNIDCSEDFVAISNFLNYKINMYSTGDYSITNNIDNGTLTNKEYVVNKINKLYNGMFINNAPKETIVNVSYLDTLLYRLESIYFLNNNKILVNKKNRTCQRSCSLIDVWEKKKQSWVKVISDQRYETNLAQFDTIIESNNIPVYFKFSHFVDFISDNVYLITGFVIPEIGMKHSDFNKYQDIYFSNHNINYQLNVYKWSID